MLTIQAPIIVSINLLRENDCLLEYAIQIASALEAPLRIFDTSYDHLFINPSHIGDPMLGTAMPVTTRPVPEWTNEVQQRMDKVVAETRKRHPDTEARLIEDFSAWNKRTSFLLEQVDTIHPQLLIIENHSSHNVLNEWFGTVETDVAQAADCPVLMVPSDCSYHPLTQINYLLERDKSLVQSTGEMQALVRLARPFNAKIDIIYLSKADKSVAQKELAVKHSHMLPLLNYEFISSSQIAHTEQLDQIDALVSSNPGELTAFAYKDSTFWDRMFSHSNTRHLILEATTLLLAF